MIQRHTDTLDLCENLYIFPHKWEVILELIFLYFCDNWHIVKLLGVSLLKKEECRKFEHF